MIPLYRKDIKKWDGRIEWTEESNKFDRLLINTAKGIVIICLWIQFIGPYIPRALPQTYAKWSFKHIVMEPVYELFGERTKN